MNQEFASLIAFSSHNSHLSLRREKISSKFDNATRCFFLYKDGVYINVCVPSFKVLRALEIYYDYFLKMPLLRKAL